MSKALTKLETGKLSELESVIERGVQTFAEVGDALAEIRDGRLYRQTHGTFEDYCRERWGFQRNYANKIISAADVIGALGTVVPKIPTERQARELVPLLSTPDVMREVVESVAEQGRRNGKPVTAADLRDAVRSKINGMASEANSDMDEATARWTPEMRQAVNPERLRQQGEVSRLIRDICKLPDPVEFGLDNWHQFSDGFGEEVEVAMEWLKSFMETKERKEA
jgi:hypothetical protein